MKSKMRVAVIGAGAFGGWTALHLLRRGAQVTLIDTWGAGNTRSSSGGETRIIRATYGPDQPYTSMSVRSLQLWREHEQKWNCQLLFHTGVLWMAADEDRFERESLPALRHAGIAFEELSAIEMSKRWPQINFDGVRWGIYEPEGGALRARFACQKVVEAFIAAGGNFRIAGALPSDQEEYGEGLGLSDGSRLVADHHVFACGPWLGQLFPRTIGERIRVTKQDVFFFGTPRGDDSFSEGRLPVWADHRERFIYGMPALDGRGFKIADDTRGSEFDPTSGDRAASDETLRIVREYLGFRFPAMRNAPLLETRVCQYENTPDNHFIIDRHPSLQNVWIVGGGSGHGFKHGPAVGETAAEIVLGGKNPPEVFRLGRFVS